MYLLKNTEHKGCARCGQVHEFVSLNSCTPLAVDKAYAELTGRPHEPVGNRPSIALAPPDYNVFRPASNQRDKALRTLKLEPWNG